TVSIRPRSWHRPRYAFRGGVSGSRRVTTYGNAVPMLWQTLVGRCLVKGVGPHREAPCHHVEGRARQHSRKEHLHEGAWYAPVLAKMSSRIGNVPDATCARARCSAWSWAVLPVGCGTAAAAHPRRA